MFILPNIYFTEFYSTSNDHTDDSDTKQDLTEGIDTNTNREAAGDLRLDTEDDAADDKPWKLLMLMFSLTPVISVIKMIILLVTLILTTLPLMTNVEGSYQAKRSMRAERSQQNKPLHNIIVYHWFYLCF